MRFLILPEIKRSPGCPPRFAECHPPWVPLFPHQGARLSLWEEYWTPRPMSPSEQSRELMSEDWP